MNQAAALALPILYCLLLAAAAVEDGWRLTISNVTNVAILIVGIVALALHAGPDWWQHPLSFLVALLVGMGLYAVGWLGGGDAKLIAAAAFAFDLGGLFRLAIAVTMIGGVLAILFLAAALFRKRREKGRKRANLPYGIAIAIGAATTLFAFPAANVILGR
jgi:prepilin peptidase CpaA